MTLLTSQLGFPDKNDYIDAKYSLNLLHVHEMAVSGAQTAVTLYNVQTFSADEPSYDNETEVFQQGGGDDSYLEQNGYNYAGRFEIQEGEWMNIIRQIFEITLADTDEVGLLNRFSPYPVATLERVARRVDNETHVFSDCYQDLILRPTGQAGSMGEMNTREIAFYSRRTQFRLTTGFELEYKTFDTDGSTVAFSMSTDLECVTDITRTGAEDWEFADAVFVKDKISGAATGTRQRDGLSIATTDVTFDTAPATSGQVQIMAVVATS